MPSKRSIYGQLTPEEQESKVSNMYINLLILPPPGLLAIKGNDLGSKVVKIVPDPFKHQYPKPLEAAVTQEKRRRKAKSRKAADNKKIKEH